MLSTENKLLQQWNINVEHEMYTLTHKAFHIQISNLHKLSLLPLSHCSVQRNLDLPVTFVVIKNLS